MQKQLVGIEPGRRLKVTTEMRKVGIKSNGSTWLFALIKMYAKYGAVTYMAAVAIHRYEIGQWRLSPWVVSRTYIVGAYIGIVLVLTWNVLRERYR